MINIHPEVRNAIKNNEPVVALETTIISHGMPFPANLETAKDVENIVRENGAVPATIGIIDGVIHVGLTEEQLYYMATNKGIVKACERDLPFVLAKELSAATTVSASLAIAEQAGITVFVTGGIGGVAPKEINSFDISADIPALSKHNCITVSSGVKSFMDIPNTIELLETLSIPVMVYKSRYFPEFYCPGEQYEVDWIADDPAIIARVFTSMEQVGYKGGMLLTVPIPEESAISRELIRKAIEAAKVEFKSSGITGKEFTPLMLKSIVSATKGESLQANIALIKNNAAVGARIAVEIAKADN